MPYRFQVAIGSLTGLDAIDEVLDVGYFAAISIASCQPLTTLAVSLPVIVSHHYITLIAKHGGTFAVPQVRIRRPDSHFVRQDFAIRSITKLVGGLQRVGEFLCVVKVPLATG